MAIIIVYQRWAAATFRYMFNNLPGRFHVGCVGGQFPRPQCDTAVCFRPLGPIGLPS